MWTISVEVHFFNNNKSAIFSAIFCILDNSLHHLFYRKASLALIRKMVHYSSEVLLKEVCDSDAGHNLPTVLVEITATVLDQEVR